jgi:hypothetical protein
MRRYFYFKFATSSLSSALDPFGIVPPVVIFFSLIFFWILSPIASAIVLSFPIIKIYYELSEPGESVLGCEAIGRHSALEPSQFFDIRVS